MSHPNTAWVSWVQEGVQSQEYEDFRGGCGVAGLGWTTQKWMPVYCISQFSNKSNDIFQNVFFFTYMYQIKNTMKYFSYLSSGLINNIKEKQTKHII